MSLEDKYRVALDDLYKEVIMDHYRRPRNRGDVPGAQVSISLNNPLCGDELTLQLKFDEERVAAAAFSGRGCSISQASASMLTEAVKGKTVAEAEEMVEKMKQMMRGDAAAGEALGDAVALAGVAKFPVRIKCALLSWEALERGVRQHRQPDPPA